MSIKIQIQKIDLKKQNNVVLFANSKLDLRIIDFGPIKKYQNLIKENVDLNKKNIKTFFSFNISPNLKITIIKIADVKFSNGNEKLGAKFFKYIRDNIISDTYFLDCNIKNFTNLNENFFDQFIFGASIKSYQFNIYKTKKKLNNYYLNIHGNLKLNFHKKKQQVQFTYRGFKFHKRSCIGTRKYSSS